MQNNLPPTNCCFEDTEVTKNVKSQGLCATRAERHRSGRVLADSILAQPGIVALKTGCSLTTQPQKLSDTYHVEPARSILIISSPGALVLRIDWFACLNPSLLSALRAVARHAVDSTSNSTFSRSFLQLWLLFHCMNMARQPRLNLAAQHRSCSNFKTWPESGT